MNTPTDPAIQRLIRGWKIAALKPDAVSQPVLGYLHTLPPPDGRQFWTNAFLLEVTDTPDKRLKIRVDPYGYPDGGKFIKGAKRLLDKAPKSNALNVDEIRPKAWGSQSMQTFTLCDWTGRSWIVASDMVGYLHSRYPAAVWYGGKRVINPIRVVDDGATVAIVMPCSPQ